MNNNMEDFKKLDLAELEELEEVICPLDNGNCSCC